MELYLQYGWGMMKHCRELVAGWGGGGVILSPRDLRPDQLERLSQDMNRLPGGSVLLDPQFYLPHANHERLRSHEFWPDDYDTADFWQASGTDRLVRSIAELNERLSTSATILPGLLATAVTDDWLDRQEQLMATAQNLRLAGSTWATIALSSEATRLQDGIAELLERSEAWPVGGCYVVCEHPKGEYLVRDPNWLANVLDLVAGLRLQGKSVVLGYCNHQMLLASAAGANAIASGTWMNVRSFPPDKFRALYEDEVRRVANWYYCPQALSEYTVPFLDIASRQGLLDTMAPDRGWGGGYASHLFSGTQPSTAGLQQADSFRHYLHCLHSQVQQSAGRPFEETVQLHRTQLGEAANLLAKLRAAGVYGQHRDFSENVDIGLSAIAVLEATRGGMLRRSWPLS